MSGTERLLERLSDGKFHSHESLYRDLGVMVHSRCADLRRKGYVIHVRREWSKSQRRNYWWYRLAPLDERPEAGEGLAAPSRSDGTGRSSSGARTSGDLVAESAPPRKPVSSPLPSPTTPAPIAAAAVLPETSSALSLFDVPSRPAWS